MIFIEVELLNFEDQNQAQKDHASVKLFIQLQGVVLLVSKRQSRQVHDHQNLQTNSLVLVFKQMTQVETKSLAEVAKSEASKEIQL